MARLRIKEIGEAKGFNMSTLSRSSNVSFTTVKRLWQHPDSVTSTDTLEMLAKALGVQVPDLFEREDEDEEAK